MIKQKKKQKKQEFYLKILPVERVSPSFSFGAATPRTKETTAATHKIMSVVSFKASTNN